MSSTKILITDGLAKEGLNILKDVSSFELDTRTKTDPKELLEIIENYDAVVVRSATKVTREVIEKSKRLKLVCRAGAGVDNVDVNAATEKKIAVMNTASANSLAAAEHTIALLFSMLRMVPQAHESMQKSKWDRTSFVGTEVTGKTLGVLGLGNIGRLVAERAVGLKMRVCGFDPFISDKSKLPKELQEHVKLLSSADEVLHSADVLTLHLPLSEKTKNFLTREKLETMKTGSFLINCARGGLVDENTVCDLLDSGKLRGAAFDVFVKEPVEYPSRIVNHPKVVVTPHLGASTQEAQDRVGLTAAQQMVGFFTRNDRTGVLN